MSYGILVVNVVGSLAALCLASVCVRSMRIWLKVDKKLESAGASAVRLFPKSQHPEPSALEELERKMARVVVATSSTLVVLVAALVLISVLR